MERSARWSPTRTLSLWTLLITTFNLAGLQHGPLPSVEAESLDTLKVSAVSGGEATLPCESRSPQPPDALLLVVWYKDDVPIYSYDGRVKGPSAHWADAVLDGRARWHATPPSSLKIRDIVAGDRALYRCRVDFKVSPTRNTKIMLDVVELPEKPKVFDEQDKEVDGVAGPYQEETSLKLTCIVSGGKPMPRLRWWRDDKVIATLAPVDDGSRISMLELNISKLSREFLDALYTCTADNTPMVPPIRANVKIEIYLRPLLVEILKREQPLSVGQDVEIGCRAIGARPPAVITWWLDGKQLSVSTVQQNSSDGNETVSILHWTPRMEHDRRVLTCRASHVILERSTIETTMTLNLHYMPIVNLQLGAKLNPNDIEEGDDVYFDCLVRANPPAYKVVWEHNGSVMTHNQRAGVIAGSAHLALQGVSKEQAGMYACTASNVEGDGRSQYVNLQVIYKPVCKNEPMIVGAPLNHSINVKCEVDAFPMPAKFLWTLNTSTGMIEFDSSMFINDGQGMSILTFTPRRDSDYGSLACRSTNLAGQQIEPCKYTIIPGVKPETPYNCTAVNLTDDSVELKCLAGYDGGLPTAYIVEAWSLGIIVANLSSPSPLWRLRTLGAGRSLRVLIFAENARGKSETVVLRIQTLSRLALLTVKDATGWDVSWALGTIAGMAGTFAIIAYFAILLRRRYHGQQFGAQMQTVKGYKGSMHTANHSPMQADDKNPDVVPLGKDFNCSRDTDPPPDPPPYGSLVTPPVGSSKSASSLHEARSNTPHTPNTPASDSQSIGTLAEDRRSVTSGTLSRRREVVTTRTPLLANARESCV